MHRLCRLCCVRLVSSVYWMLVSLSLTWATCAMTTVSSLRTSCILAIIFSPVLFCFAESHFLTLTITFFTKSPSSILAKFDFWHLQNGIRWNGRAPFSLALLIFFFFENSVVDWDWKSTILGKLWSKIKLLSTNKLSVMEIWFVCRKTSCPLAHSWPMTSLLSTFQYHGCHKCVYDSWIIWYTSVTMESASSFLIFFIFLED